MSGAAKRKYSAAAQLAEAKRQLAMMRGIYPAMIAAHPEILDQSTADMDVEAMAAVVETMAWLEAHADIVRRVAAMPPGKADGAMTPAEARRYALGEAIAIAKRAEALDVAGRLAALPGAPQDGDTTT